LLALAVFYDFGENYGMTIEWHVGDVLKKLRESVKKTQREIADYAKVRMATISSIESTGKYNPETLRKYAAALKMSVAEIHALVPSGDVSKPASGADSEALLCDNPDHRKLFKILDGILHTEEQCDVPGFGRTSLPHAIAACIVSHGRNGDLEHLLPEKQKPTETGGRWKRITPKPGGR
jgi:transcriptional regulator with XRE-family HTH domain